MISRAMSQVGLRGAVLLLAAMLPAAAASETLKIGVLVPAAESLHSIGQQLVVGTKIAVENLWNRSDAPRVELEFHRGDFSHSVAVDDAYRALIAADVDVVIGGVTPMSAAVLYEAVGQGLPTIVLADGSLRGETEPPKHLLQLGLSEADVYRVSLKRWIDEFNIKKVSVLYGGDHWLPFRYGAKVTASALKTFETEFKLQDIASTGGRVPEGYKELVDVNMGIVVSGLPWDTAHVVQELSMTKVQSPIFIAPPVSSISEIADLAMYSKVPIYYGTQFWPKPNDETAQDFMEVVRAELGWSRKEAVSNIAVRAHDAVQVIVQAWLAGGQFKTWPWQQLGTVTGAVGLLTLQKNRQIMAGPVDLLVGEADGALKNNWGLYT